MQQYHLSEDMLIEAYVLYTNYKACFSAIRRTELRARECANHLGQSKKCDLCKPWVSQVNNMKRFIRSERQSILNWIRLVRSFYMIPNLVTVTTPGVLKFLVSFMKDVCLHDPHVGDANLVATDRSLASWIDEQWGLIKRSESAGQIYEFEESHVFRS